ncbi:MAG: DUF359 domain-containing protein [Candidatus Heimdallarchaeota archaeon]|nr:DUF359 domain-containing protein [Candidatus Heimdallarchaeota archaeon]
MNQVKPGYYFLPQNQRKYFKTPLGKVITNKQDIIEIANKINQDNSIPKIITVGDVTTQTFVELSIIPDIAIIDEYVQRKRVPLLQIPDVIIVEISNPAGYITSEAWTEIIKSLKIEENKIIIKIIGEEDLLVLPSILEAPLDSKVLYGQPNEGLVVVSVTEEVKQSVYELIRKMVKINED